MTLRHVRMLTLVFCLAPSLAFAEEIRKEFHETFEVEPGTVLELHHGDGDVTLTPWDKEQIQVDVIYHADITKVGFGSRPSFDVRFRQTDDRVVVEEKIGGSTTIGFYSCNEIKYTYEIKAPARSGLEFHGDDGDVRITGWNGHTELTLNDGNVILSDFADGDVRINLDDGDVEMSDITAGTVQINLNDGDVEGKAIHAALKIDSDDGDVRITGLVCPDLATSTNDGSINIEFPDRIPDRIEAVADDGNISFRFRTRGSFAYDITTDDGTIRLDLPDGAGGRREDRADGGKLSGNIGDGGGLVNIRTNDGSVEIIAE